MLPTPTDSSRYGEAASPARPVPKSRHSGGWLRSRAALIKAQASRKVRDNGFAIAALGTAVGAVVGLGVVLLHQFLGLMHALLFGLPVGAHLSAGVGLGFWEPFAVPALGGLAIGLLGLAVRRRRTKDIVDAIEANALYGGKMSLLDSLRLVALTLLSNMSGASVGMEAAYTQIGAGLASKAGQSFNLRRADLRIMVGCGAAAAIASAFNAPIAGAFYAFELVIGSYTLASLVPVSLAAVTASVVTRGAVGGDPIFSVHDTIGITAGDYLLFGVIGLGAALLGIVTMQAVTLAERLFRGARLPLWARPLTGGVLVGAVALVFPQVLGSGHGAIQHTIDIGYGLPVLAMILMAKIAASALSLGSGFRGGLFSSSLFLGCLYGSLFASAVAWLFPDVVVHHTAFVLIGMGSVAAAIIGAPITMVLLVQEATADFPATVGVLTSVVVATMIVRQFFGYSFATWRFHLRGVPIHGAHDIGWIANLTVDRLMRRDAKSVPANMTVAGLRRAFPPGSTKQVYVVDDKGCYAGILDIPAIHASSLDAEAEKRTAGSMARSKDMFLLPRQNVRQAVKLFVASEEETLPVVESGDGRRILGYLTEAYALRRFNHELERRRAEELGERDLLV